MSKRTVSLGTRSGNWSLSPISAAKSWATSSTIQDVILFHVLNSLTSRWLTRVEWKTLKSSILKTVDIQGNSFRICFPSLFRIKYSSQFRALLGILQLRCKESMCIQNHCLQSRSVRGTSDVNRALKVPITCHSQKADTFGTNGGVR